MEKKKKRPEAVAQGLPIKSRNLMPPRDRPYMQVALTLKGIAWELSKFFSSIAIGKNRVHQKLRKKIPTYEGTTDKKTDRKTGRLSTKEVLKVLR